jgi:hypothetical protein
MNSKIKNETVNEAQPAIANPLLSVVPERILCSAIWYKKIKAVPSEFSIHEKTIVSNISEGVVICGHRHYNCILTLIYLSGYSTKTKDCGEYEQGFLTSNNRFIGRKEAAQIAFAAGQTKELKETLFSEDVW